METLTEILGLSVHDMGNDMEKTIEQHRDEFEGYIKSVGYNENVLEKILSKNKRNEYLSSMTRHDFITWLAARGIKE